LRALLGGALEHDRCNARRKSESVARLRRSQRRRKKSRRVTTMPDGMSAKAWIDKAAALRSAAATAVDDVTRQSLLVLAEDCEALARESDARAVTAPARTAATREGESQA
jgi:hypothetical protein